jgi:hypothetical protein
MRQGITQDPPIIVTRGRLRAICIPTKLVEVVKPATKIDKIETLTRWRNRIGEEGVEWLLTETIRAGGLLPVSWTRR